MTVYHQSTQKFIIDNCGKCYLLSDGCPYGECIPCYIGADLIEKGVEDVNKSALYLPEKCPSWKICPYLLEEEKK